MATGATVIAKARYQLQDATDESFDSDHLLDWANLGAKEFCATTGCLQDTQTIATDGALFRFLLSTYCTNPIKAYAVEFGGVPLTPSFRYEISTEYGAVETTPDSSHGWYEYAGYLYIEVKAPATAAASALNIFYIRTPTDMTATTSTFDFPDEWTPAIVEYIVAKAFESQRDTVLAAQHLAKYESSRQTAWSINKYKLMGDAT